MPASMTRRRWADVLCVLAVIAIVGHNFFAVRTARDVGADDESWYVAGGVLLGKPGFPEGPNGLPIPELGALHCLSYFPLSKIVRVPIDLFYVCWQLRITLIALAIFAIVRRAGRVWWQGLLASFVFVMCAIADVWPFPVHTAALVVLSGLVVASFTKTVRGALGATVITFAFAAFTRPELMYGYAVSILFFVVYLVRTKAWRPALKWIPAVIVPGVLGFAILGNPYDGERSWAAFAQHYTLMKFEETHNRLDPWANWGETVAVDFPNAHSVFQAMKANPGAFGSHVFRNLERLPRNTYLATKVIYHEWDWVEMPLFILLCAFAAIQIRRAWLDRRTIAWTPARLAMFFAIACAAVPFSLSIVIVHPRLHYFVVVVTVAIAILFSQPLGRLEERAIAWEDRLAVRPWAAMLFAIGFLAATLSPAKSHARISEWLTNEPRASRKPFGNRQRTILQLRNSGFDGKLRVLESSWGTCFYAGYDCTSFLRWDKRLPFDDFVREQNIDAVIFDLGMTEDVRFIDDAQFKDFMEHPAAHGFDIVPVELTDVRIGVRRR
jgi:hypothetical protein